MLEAILNFFDNLLYSGTPTKDDFIAFLEKVFEFVKGYVM